MSEQGYSKSHRGYLTHTCKARDLPTLTYVTLITVCFGVMLCPSEQEIATVCNSAPQWPEGLTAPVSQGSL